MKFFFPVADSEVDAEACWNVSRMLLADRGFPTAARRILALGFHGHDDEPRWLQVGMELAETGETVQAIFRARRSPFYWVVTPCHGLLEGAPYPVPARRGTFAVEFDEDGRAEDPPA